jgi:hypothetical protein
MKFFSLLILLIILKLSISDINAGQKEFQKLERKAKTLACQFLTSNFLSSVKESGKKLKDILKQNNIIHNESEAKDKISQFMLVNCYLKITPDIANKVILDISKGSIDFKKNKQYLNLFEMNEKTDFNKLAQTMKEIKEILKEIKAEEEIFKKRKMDDPNFEKNLKDFEEKMKKTYEQKKNEKNKSNNKAKYTQNKKKKGNGKKPYEGTKWEIVHSSKENLVNLSDIIFNPKKFFDVTGLNTICGMIIMTLIILNLVQLVQNIKSMKDEKNNGENNIDIEEINNINDDNDNENEEEEKDEDNNDDNSNNINNTINKMENEIKNLKTD